MQHGGRTSLGGRTSALGEARNLLLLWSALEGGATLDVDTVSRRLGVDGVTAEKLIGLLATAKGANDDYLPLYSEDETMKTGIGLASSSSGYMSAMRLTGPELNALFLALDTIGVSADDPLRKKLERASKTDGSLPPSETELSKTLSTAYASPSGNVLWTISQALVQPCDLLFSYQGSFDEVPLQRRVMPRRIHHDDRLWYLEAYDLDRMGERTFRIDRMSRVTTEPKQMKQPPAENVRSNRRQVTLHFVDRTYLTSLDWPGLQVLQEDDKGITAVLPYYEDTSTWLVRRIASCAGNVTTTDNVLSQRITDYALTLLKHAQD